MKPKLLKPKLLVKEYATKQNIKLTQLVKLAKLNEGTIRHYWYSEASRLDWNTMELIAWALGIENPKDLIADKE